MTIGKSERETVRTFCLGYERRRRAAALLYVQTDVSLFRVLVFLSWNERIDKALTAIDEPFRLVLLQDIARGRGYRASPLRGSLTNYGYYNAKSKAVEGIAKALNLIL